MGNKGFCFLLAYQK